MSHIRKMWQLLVDFLRDFIGEAVRGTKQHWKGIAIFTAVAFVCFIILIALLLKATASYKFCGMCHNMDIYIQSWKESTHKNVSCLECHFEPGVWGELKGKWKAQTHVVMKITGTAPPRPHTEISDASCLREGCHSLDKLRESSITYKGVAFSHGTHLDELRRGKKLKCVSCHSQIVQGKHLTVTETTCFTCHFYQKEEHPEMADCQLCHVKTKVKLFIDANKNLPFKHREYLDRKVSCRQCHFDIIAGDGHLKDNICVQCHAEPKILRSKYDSEHIHMNHVTLHKVECFRCHAVIQHFIPRPADSPVPGKQIQRTELTGYHYDTNCIKCHALDQHDNKRLMFMGKGASDLPDLPSRMYLAHLDCASCHVKLSETDGVFRGIKRDGFEEIIKSCSDCHGPGYDDMAKHWKKLLTKQIELTKSALLNARNQLAAHKKSPSYEQASLLIEQAGKNLRFTIHGKGLHNIDYALKLLADSREKVEKSLALITPGYQAKKITSPSGCTTLCHSCVECIETKPVPFGNVEFPHDVHVSDEGLACLDCHSPRSRHGETYLKNCNECHHGSGAGAVQCEDCHVATYNLYHGQNGCDEISCDVQGKPNPMVKEVKCAECHVQVTEGDQATVDGIKQTCVDCHDDSYAAMVDDWEKQAKAMNLEKLRADLEEIQQMVLLAIRNGQYTYDAQDLINNADKNLTQLEKGNPIHNLKFSSELVSKVQYLLSLAREKLQRHSTIKTLQEGEYISK